MGNKSKRNMDERIKKQNNQLDSSAGNVTLDDIASRAGVSQSTVSRVINKPYLVHRGTAEQVRHIMQEIGYVVPKSKTSINAMTIGVSLPDVSDPFFTMLLKGIVDGAYYRNIMTPLLSGGNSSQIQAVGIERFITGGMDALIVVPVSSEENFIRELESHSVPIIYLDRVPKKKPLYSVVCDDYEGALQATQYLLSMGHSSIAYIGGDTDLSTERERLAGYRAAIEMVGLDPIPELIYEQSFDQERIQKLDFGELLTGRSFTAVFAANDNLAVSVIEWIRKQGLRVPEDVSVMGYNDMPFSRHLGLSTVSSPAYEMGKNAVWLVHAIMEQRVLEAHQIVLKPRLIIRSSCAPPRSNR